MHLYYRPDGPEASLYLRKRLAAYETMHRKCVNALSNTGKSDSAKYEQTDTEGESGEGDGCRYIVAGLQNGIGNQILSAVSTFLYALLTNRTLLMRETGVLQHLCNPFPGSECIANATKFKPALISPFQRGRQWEDEVFYCPHGQSALSNIPWLLLTSDIYYVPSLFYLPQFLPELSRLFPTRDVFVHLGPYLLRPSNVAWERITRLHATHYSGANSKVGIQVRTFTNGKDTYANDNIIKCAIDTAQVLPPVLRHRTLSASSADKNASERRIGIPNPHTIFVFFISLNMHHVEFIQSWYSEGPINDGSSVQVWSGTHRGVELTFSRDVDVVKRAGMEALCEIFILSFSDTLLTSDMSTFGYVAAGLNGKPFFKVNNKWDLQNVSRPKCTLEKSSEICQHCPPCRSACVGTSSLLEPCTDWPWGVMLLTTRMKRL